MDTTHGRREPRNTSSGGEVEAHKDRIERELRSTTKTGFQKVRVRGTSPTDKEFNERLEKHTEEIEEFYRLYPEEREGRDIKGRFEPI